MDTIYLDFAKAFDKVDHSILLHKVRALGIQGKIGVWIHSFLSVRTQVIAVDGAKSQHSSVKWCSSRVCAGATVVSNYAGRYQQGCEELEVIVIC